MKEGENNLPVTQIWYHGDLFYCHLKMTVCTFYKMKICICSLPRKLISFTLCPQICEILHKLCCVLPP